MKYNQASYKQSHNSYDRDEDSHESLAFHPDDPGKAGCRGLEYDIWRHSDDSKGRSLGYFTIAHDFERAIRRSDRAREVRGTPDAATHTDP